MKGRDSYWDKSDHQRELDELIAKREAETVAKWTQIYKQFAQMQKPAPKPAPPTVRREADEPTINASTAAYLAEWFAR